MVVHLFKYLLTILVSLLWNATSYLLPYLIIYLLVRYFVSTRHDAKGFHIVYFIHPHKLLPWVFYFGTRDLYMLISLCCCIRYLFIDLKKKEHTCKFPNLLAVLYIQTQYIYFRNDFNSGFISQLLSENSISFISLIVIFHQK